MSAALTLYFSPKILIVVLLGFILECSPQRHIIRLFQCLFIFLLIVLWINLAGHQPHPLSCSYTCCVLDGNKLDFEIMKQSGVWTPLSTVNGDARVS